MRKSLVFATLAGLVLASCSNEEFVGGPANSLQTDEIGFSTGVPNMTRATVGGADAARKLNNRFVVYGWKTVSSSPVDVFNNYVVTWNGNSGNSLSNTAGWEYVGNTTSPTDGSQGVNQFIKYWDYSATSYDFIAWSVTGTAYLESINKSYSETGYKTTALTFQCKDATAVSNVYFSNQKTVEKANYKTKVDLTFRNLAAKVRLGIYETVPGYSVKDVKFYTDATSATPCDNATLFVTPNHTPKPYQLPTSGSILVKYSDGTSGTAGDAVTVTTPAQTATYMQFGVFSADKGPEYKEQDRDFIGRTSSDATLSKSSTDGWTYVMPNDTCELNLKVDYTLVPNDGSAATITVKGAAAVIPASYGEWKSNCAYTYIFKISDNTNGTTGSSTTDPSGLYPLTFDACVEDAESSGIQETVTSLTTPSITTYQKGSEVTKENEYKAGDITSCVYDPEVVGSKPIGDVTLTKDNFKLYDAVSTDGGAITEANVANYKNNGLVLTDISSLLKGLNSTSVTFKGEAGRTYVAEYRKGADKFYKIIKVTGSAAAPVFRFEAYESAICAPITETDSVMESAKIYVKVKQMIGSKEYCVAGAEKNFDATTAQYFDVTAYNDTVYKLTSKAGIENDVNVPLGIRNVTTASTGSATIRIINYHFTLDGGNVKAGSTNNDILWLYRSVKLHMIDLATQFKVYKDDVDVTSQNMLKITGNSKADGKYDIEVADDAAGKYVVNYYNGTATCEITVDTFTITPTYSSANVKALNVGGIAAEKSATLTLKCGGQLAKGDAVTNAATTVAQLAGEDGSTHKATTDATTGAIVLTAKAAGTAKVSAPGELIEIPVYDFAVKFYSDASCSTAFTGDFKTGQTYYAKFTDSGTARNAALQTSSGTWTKLPADGCFSWVAPSAVGNMKVTYQYEGNTFTLYEQNVSN